MELKNLMSLANTYSNKACVEFGLSDKEEVYSYVLSQLHRLQKNLDEKTYSPKECCAYINRCVRGYVQHWIRGHSNLIKTPRNHPFFSSQRLLDSDTIYYDEYTEELPDFIYEIMEDFEFRRRIANAYLRYLSS